MMDEEKSEEQKETTKKKVWWDHTGAMGQVHCEGTEIFSVDGDF